MRLIGASSSTTRTVASMRLLGNGGRWLSRRRSPGDTLERPRTMNRSVLHPSANHRRPRRSRRHWPWIALAALVLLAVAGVAGWLATRGGGAKDSAAATTSPRRDDPRPARRRVVRAQSRRPLVAT